METVRIIAVEDDDTYVDALTEVFNRQQGIEMVGAYRNPVVFLGDLPKLECDVILLDVRLPRLSGLECIEEIREFAPKARIIMLTVHDDEDFVLQSFLDGADGYLLKDSTPDQIIQGIRDAMKGGAPMSASVARKLLQVLGDWRGPGKQSGQAASGLQQLLSPREYEILHLLAKGKKYTEIAEEIFLSVDTVKTHIRHIYSKLEVRNKAEAISRLFRDERGQGSGDV